MAEGSLIGPFRDLFAWIVSPQSLIRWLERYQERRPTVAPYPEERATVDLPVKVDAIWIANTLWAATMMGGPLADRRYWILDNDGKYGNRTAAILGSHLVWTSIRVPDMNAYIERWNRSAQDECLDHVVILSEASLRKYVEAYIYHHHAERPHQGIGNVPIENCAIGTGEIVCDKSLGRLLKAFPTAAISRSL